MVSFKVAMKTLKKAFTITSGLVKREIDYYRLRPTNLLLFLTYRCTSRCNTCTMWQRKTQESELSLEEWKSFIDSVAASYKIKNVEMFGGDALLRKDVLLPLTAYIRKKTSAEVDLITNCNLMDESTARSLVDSGINVIAVSLDGVGQTHDKVRGFEGSFSNVEKGITHLLKARGSKKKPVIVANCTVSSLNVDSFEKVLDFAQHAGVDDLAFEYVGEFPQGCLSHSRVNGIQPQPYFLGHDPSLLLNTQQAMLLKNKIRDIKDTRKKYSVRIVTRNIDVLGLRELTSGCFPNKKCYICRYLITVDPFGNIIPCPFFNNYHLGKVPESPCNAVWGNQRHRQFIHAADTGKIAMCKYCILGVERNATILQEIQQSYLTYRDRAIDE